MSGAERGAELSRQMAARKAVELPSTVDTATASQVESPRPAPVRRPVDTARATHNGHHTTPVDTTPDRDDIPLLATKDR